MKKNKCWKNMSKVILILIACIGIMGYFLNQDMTASKAALADGVYLKIGSDANMGDVYEVRTSELEITVVKVENGAEIPCILTDVQATKDMNKDLVTTAADPAGNGYRWKMTAQNAGGPVDLRATYTDPTTGNNVDVYRKIQVPYAFNEDSRYFTKIYETDVNNVMILACTDDVDGIYRTGTLKYLFPVTGVNWSSGDNQVVTINSTTGEFMAIGTGKTRITASYNNADGNLITTSVDVYVGPSVSKDNVGVRQNNFNIGVPGQVFTGANASGGTQTLLSEKIGWETKKILSDNSMEPTDKKIFDHQPYDTKLSVVGKAGKYSVDFYTKGIDITKQLSDKAKKCLVQTVQIGIYATPKDIAEVTLQVDDIFDIAEAYNMEVEDFIKCFNIASSAPQYNGEGNKITAVEEGAATVKIALTAEGVSILGSTIPVQANIPQGTEFQIPIRVYRGFFLSITKAILYIGETKLLEPMYPGGNMGTLSWSSSDDSKVKVENGYITGVSEGDATITVSMTLSSGKIMKATCKVTVTKTATKITLTPDTADIEVDQSVTIKASFTPSNVIPSNLSWQIMDETVATLSVGTDGKSAVVTGKKAGSTMVTVVNKDNAVIAFSKITVLSPITSIQLDKDTLTIKKSRGETRLVATIFPTDATSKTLYWYSDDATIASVDQNGWVTPLKPGTTYIRVRPEWNPQRAYAECRVTVIDSASSFSLNTKALTLEVGSKETLKPVIAPDGASTDITWTSMDTSIATVSNGVVTAVKAGQTYIVANTPEGFIDNCKVTVTQKATGISLSSYSINIAVGEEFEVTATPNPTTSTETKFTWTSKDTSIATVNNGKVTGVSAGSTIILVKTKSGEVVYLYVTVYDKAKGMTLNYSDKTVAKGKTFTLKPIFTPSNVSNKKVTWKSLKTSVATISDKGKVKGIRGGSAIITAVSDDGGYMATCLVTVVQPVSKVKLNYSSYKLGIGKTVGLKATVTSNSSSNSKVKWTSSNTSVASVSSSGKVKGKKLGTCTITARATDGSGKKATCKIRVVRQVSSISLNKPVLTLTVSQTKKLTAKVSPSNATYKTVKWTSSNKDVAVVDTKGNVTGLTVGTTTIKASAKDNSKESASCYVNVIDPIPASGIVVSAKDIILIRGQSQMISYTITPSNHTDKVTFASDNKAIATVTSTGKIYARRTGAATITITTSSGKQATINVTVIGLNKTSITLEQYDTETLIVDGVSTGITWYSSNPSIATVVGGKVVARKRGTCMIYAKVSGITLSCRVTVKNISKS